MQECDHKVACKKSLRKHILSIHDGIKFNCHQRDYQANQRETLRMHIHNVHEGMKYKCDHQTTHIRYLRSQVYNKHNGIE